MKKKLLLLHDYLVGGLVLLGFVSGVLILLFRSGWFVLVVFKLPYLGFLVLPLCWGEGSLFKVEFVKRSVKFKSNFALKWMTKLKI